MRTFERRHNDSIWVWDIDLTGRQLTVIHGKRDRPGEVLRYGYTHTEQAEKEYGRRIRDKLREGYVETTPPGAGPPANVRESLEQALAADPDDLGTHMAYADYLQEQGDPRGELIQVQLALEDETRSAAERKKLQKHEKELLAAHQRRWLADLFDVSLFLMVRFRRGWLDTLHIPSLSVDLARVLVRSPQVRLLRRLEIHTCKWERTDSTPPADDLPPSQEYPANYVLARTPFLGNLRVLLIDPQEGDSPGTGRYPGGNSLLELLPRLFRLEELSLNAENLDTERLFATPLPPTLRILRLQGARIQGQAQALLRSELLKQLEVLQLRNVGLTDVVAGELARRLPGSTLKTLDVSYNNLTVAGIETLRATGINLISEDQWGPGADEDDILDDIME